jgi:hypothetical protein
VSCLWGEVSGGWLRWGGSWDDGGELGRGGPRDAQGEECTFACLHPPAAHLYCTLAHPSHTPRTPILTRKERLNHSQPGVLSNSISKALKYRFNEARKTHEAFGYVKITTPAPLFSSSSPNVTSSPSFVWTVPPKEERSAMVEVVEVSFSLVLVDAVVEEACVERGEEVVDLEVEEETAALALSARVLILDLRGGG